MEKITHTSISDKYAHMLSICYQTGVGIIKIRGVNSITDVALIHHHSLDKDQVIKSDAR